MGWVGSVTCRVGSEKWTRRGQLVSDGYRGIIMGLEVLSWV